MEGCIKLSPFPVPRIDTFNMKIHSSVTAARQRVIHHDDGKADMAEMEAVRAWWYLLYKETKRTAL